MPTEMLPMPRRQFERRPPAEVGAPQARYRLTCGACGQGENLGPMQFGIDLAQQLVPKKFTEKGWEVGKHSALDRCPACVEKEKHQAYRKRHNSLSIVPQQEPTPMPIKPVADVHKADFSQMQVLPNRVVMVPPAPMPAPTLTPRPQAEPPREMTRDDRRIVFSALQDHYLDESTGYSDGWSDKRVAEHLGVPRAWVAKIRDENFGPAKSEAVEGLAKDLKSAVEEMTKLRETVNVETKRLVDKCVDLDKALAELKRRVADVERSML